MTIRLAHKEEARHTCHEHFALSLVSVPALVSGRHTFEQGNPDFEPKT